MITKEIGARQIFSGGDEEVSPIATIVASTHKSFRGESEKVIHIEQDGESVTISEFTLSLILGWSQQ
jgi:hypothetical protein